MVGVRCALGGVLCLFLCSTNHHLSLETVGESSSSHAAMASVWTHKRDRGAFLSCSGIVGVSQMWGFDGIFHYIHRISVQSAAISCF